MIGWFRKKKPIDVLPKKIREKPLRLFAIGPESSGHHLFQDIFSKHKQVKLFITSFPRENYPNRRYVDLQKHFKVKITPDDFLLVLTRDRQIATASTIAHNHNHHYPYSDFSFAKTIEKIQEQINLYFLESGRYGFFNYETLMVWREFYLRYWFTRLEIDDNFDYSGVNYNNANNKYLRKEFL